MAVKAEVIGDVEQGAPSGEADELGLNAEERAAWDSMQAAEKIPDDGEGSLAPEEAPEVPAEGAEKPADAVAADGEDEGDDAVEAAEAAPAIDPKTGKLPQKQVSWQKHQRLLAKRDGKLATAEKELQTERENRVKLAERLAILNEALTAPAPADPVKAQQDAVAANPMLEPDIKVEDDALGAIAQLQRRNAYLQQHVNQTHEVTAATLEDQQLQQAFERDAAAYSRSEDGQHFGAAYQFLKDSRLTELAISLYDKDPNDPTQVFSQAEITRLVNDFNAEEKWVVTNARKGGKSPSAAIMKLAKGRGFKPPSAEQAAPPVAAAALAPVAPAPAKNGNGAPPAASAVAKIQAETEAAAASKSLSDGGGAPPALELTPDRLLKMGDDEFGAFIDNLPKHKLDALMGRPSAQ